MLRAVLRFSLAPRMLRWTTLVCSFAFACTPTETGNPSANVTVAPQAFDVMGLAPTISVSELVLGGAAVDLVRAEGPRDACDLPEPLVDVESYEPLTRRGERVELATSLPIDDYCGVEGEVYPSSRLEGLVLAVDGIRLADGATVRIRAYGEAVPLDLALREGFAIPEEGIALHFLVDADVIVNTVPELATLRAMDGLVRVDATNAPEVLALVLERLRGAVSILEDLDGDREIDVEDRAAVIAAPASSLP